MNFWTFLNFEGENEKSVHEERKTNQTNNEKKKKEEKRKEKETKDITRPKGKKKTRMIHDEKIKRNYEWRT